MEIKLLSFFLDEKTPAYGGIKNSFKKFPISNISNGDTSNSTKFEFPGHLGTHIDFPRHFDNNGNTLQNYPYDFWVFNKVGFLNCNLENLSSSLNTLSIDIEILILKTGFGIYRGKEKYWKEQPVIPANFADLLSNKFPNLRAFGFDMISLTSKLDRKEGKLAHINFLINNNILIIEDMNLTELQMTPDMIIVAPILISNVDGVPCTIFSFITN